MRQVRYGVAMSLDGYIAGPSGESDWIVQDPDIDFNEIGSRYAELENESLQWPRMRWLMELLTHVPDGGAVLDVGCGNGVPATRAISERFEAPA